MAGSSHRRKCANTSTAVNTKPLTGPRDMPIWGYAFMYRQSSHNGPGGAPLPEQEVHHKITRLIDDIKTIQVK